MYGTMSSKDAKCDIVYWLNRGGTIHYNPRCDPAIPRINTHREHPGVIPFPVSILNEILRTEPLKVAVDEHGEKTYSVPGTKETATREEKRNRIGNNASIIRECQQQLWGDYDPETRERLYRYVTSKPKRMEN